MITKLFLLFFLFLGSLFYSQNAELFEYDPETKMKLAMIEDTITGDWLLSSKLTIGKGKNDTLSQKYNTSKSSPAGSRLKIILSFKAGGELVITEFPLGKKIEVTNARWRVHVKSGDYKDPFFFKFTIRLLFKKGLL